MKIGIDARFYGVTGIGRYLQNLLKQLELLDNDNQYVIFLKEEKFDSYQPRHANFRKMRADYAWYSLSEQLFFLRDLYQEKCTLIHFPHINVPVLYLRPFVVTIHDLITHDAKKGATTRNPIHFYLKKLVYKLVVWWTAIRAKAIIVPTNQVKEQVATRLGIKPDKIFVTYEAVDDLFFQDVSQLEQQDPDQGRKVLKKYGINSPYVLYVSSFYPHKNHRVLIDAFELLQLEGYRFQGKPLQLVLVGKQDKFSEERYAYVEHKDLTKSVVFPGKVAPNGYTPDQDLLWIMKQAHLYVCPSKQEGFGITFLEAMAMSLPVILSNASCLPEIGQDAAVYFSPDEPRELKEKIKLVLEDEQLQNELIAKGHQRVDSFSWQKMAEQTLRIYQKVV
jgi:glycosyltransferase involved in cell wall biosynthesis